MRSLEKTAISSDLDSYSSVQTQRENSEELATLSNEGTTPSNDGTTPISPRNESVVSEGNTSRSLEMYTTSSESPNQLSPAR